MVESSWTALYGEMMLSVLSDYGPNTAHWENPSVTSAISMFSNAKDERAHWFDPS